MRDRITPFAVLAASIISIGLLFGCNNKPTEPTPNCSVAIAPATLAFGGEGGTGVVAVSVTSSCTWTATAGESWIAITEGASGTGSGAVRYSVAANPGSQARTGTITIGDQVHTVTQQGQGACAYQVAPMQATFGAGGGSASLTVTAGAGCSWTAATSADWVTINSGSSGNGNGTVSYTVAANAAASNRATTIRVAGIDVEIAQSAAGCSFDVGPTSADYGADGGQGSINVGTSGSCAWAATTSDSWLNLGSSGGTGSGSVSYSVARNSGAASRTGTIHVADADVRITQSGSTAACEYQVAPVQFSPCMDHPLKVTATVTTQPSCPWTSTSGASWLTVTEGQSGSGSGVVTASFPTNWALPRTGIVMVRWPTATAGQNLQVVQAGCTYAVSNNSFTFGVGGGADHTDVLQSSDPNECSGPLQNACRWTAETTASWITIITPVPHVGDDPLNFTVAPNATGQSRQGTIVVRGDGGPIDAGSKVVVITQSGS